MKKVLQALITIGFTGAFLSAIYVGLLFQWHDKTTAEGRAEAARRMMYGAYAGEVAAAVGLLAFIVLLVRSGIAWRSSRKPSQPGREAN